MYTNTPHGSPKIPKGRRPNGAQRREMKRNFGQEVLAPNDERVAAQIRDAILKMPNSAQIALGLRNFLIQTKHPTVRPDKLKTFGVPWQTEAGTDVFKRASYMVDYVLSNGKPNGR